MSNQSQLLIQGLYLNTCDKIELIIFQQSEVFDKWGELDHDAESTDEISKRLAVCNMDWDRVGAEDLFLILSSFCPSNERVLKISIFPSEFGKKRMSEEDQKGPEELRGRRENSDSESESENHKNDIERVRKYQVNRLKYYYAVAEFSSEEAANSVYTQCDGSEYELSATRFDLRFIPDEMEFNEDPPKEVCDTMPNIEKYKPKFFSTTALSLGKVDLTWDETDPQRLAAMQKAFDDDNDENLKKYIANSSSESDNEEKEEELQSEDDEKVIAKYRALLQNSGDNPENESESENEMNKEMSFVPESDIKKKEVNLDEMTPWEKYLHKKKEKRKAKKAKKGEESDEDDLEKDDELPSDVDVSDPFFKPEPEKAKKSMKKKKSPEKSENLELLAMDSDDDRKHFDYKDIVKNEGKRKKRKRGGKKEQKVAENEDNFQLDLADSRFSAVFNNPTYNVDPSHPSFKKTKSMASIIEEKQKRILKGDEKLPEEPKQKKSKNLELDSLVNSVKSKSKKKRKQRL